MIGERISDLLFESVVELGDIRIINNRVLGYNGYYHHIKYQIGNDYCVSYGNSYKYFIEYKEYYMDITSKQWWMSFSDYIY